MGLNSFILLGHFFPWRQIRFIFFPILIKRFNEFLYLFYMKLQTNRNNINESTISRSNTENFNEQMPRCGVNYAILRNESGRFEEEETTFCNRFRSVRGSAFYAKTDASFRYRTGKGLFIYFASFYSILP